MSRNNSGKFNWNEFTLIDSDGGKFTIDDYPRQYADALDEFKTYGNMNGIFFEKIGVPGEDETDSTTWGPQSPDEIDWSGFEV